MTSASLALRLEQVQREIADALQRSGRSDQVTLVLASKTIPPDRILEAYRAGHRDFGENRVQELCSKKTQLPSDIRWHFIGHLQTNKVKDVVGGVALMHSLDREELADRLDREAAKRAVGKLACLIQVNASGESSKFGIRPEDAEPFAERLERFHHLEILGLMTLGPLTDDQVSVRKVFRQTRLLFDKMRARYPRWCVLSMGMSGDYRIAVEEGATLVRIGTAVFGQRQ